MSKSKIKRWQIFSTIIVMILGTLLHFTYEWSGQNNVVALFSAVNESVWEHLKLLFFPMLLVTIIGFILNGKYLPGYVCASTIGIVASMLFTVFFYYIYTGIVGKDIAVVNILSFFVSVALGGYVTYKLMQIPFPCCTRASFIFLATLAIYFFIFTFCPPDLGIFKDPVSGSHGIEAAFLNWLFV